MGLKPNKRKQAHKAHNIHIKEKEKPKLPLVEHNETEQRVTTSDRGKNCIKKKKKKTKPEEETNVAKLGSLLSRSPANAREIMDHS